MKKAIKVLIMIATFFTLSFSVFAADEVSMAMEVFVKNGEQVEKPEDLTAGEHTVTVKILNLNELQKNLEVFVAVKTDGKLSSVSKKTSTISKDPITKFFEVEIPVTITEAENIQLEAYCWNDGLVPYAEKLIFGQEKYESYTVYGRIVATSRNDSSLDANEVRFIVEKSDNFDGYPYGPEYYGSSVWAIQYNNPDAYNMMFQYAKAIVLKDENDNYILTSVEIINEPIKKKAILYDSYTGTKLNFYESMDSTKTIAYKLSDIAEMYVNGVEIGTLSEEYVNTYITGNDCGTVTFIDVTEEGSTDSDGKFDYVFVDYYVDAVIESVSVNDETYKLYFADMNPNVKNLSVDTTDSDITVRYTLNGEEIKHTELLEGDVLSIAYDVTNNFDYSEFYDIIVSRNVVSGMVTSSGDCYTGSGVEYFIIGNTKYSAAASMYGWVNAESLKAGTSYTLYVNAFGNFVMYYENAEEKKIAVFDMAFTDSFGNPMIRLITSDGEMVSYRVKGDDISTYLEWVKLAYEDTSEEDTDGKYTDNSNKKNINERIVEYTVNSAGYLSKLVVCETKTSEVVLYKASSLKLGTSVLNSNAVVLDLSENEDMNDISVINKLSVDELTDGCEYSVCLANWSAYDETYYYMIITEIGECYEIPDDEETELEPVNPIAVYRSTYTIADEYGTQTAVIKAYEEGAEREILSVLEAVPSMSHGDVFVYETDEDGYVTEIVPIFTGAEDAYETFIESVSGISASRFENSDKYDWGEITDMPQEWIETSTSSKTGNVEILFGVITDKKSDTVYVSQISDDLINIDNEWDYTVLSDANIYVYDYTMKQGNRLSIGSASSIEKSPYATSWIDDNGNLSILEDGKYRELNFIFAKLVDGDIAEALVILGS